LSQHWRRRVLPEGDFKNGGGAIFDVEDEEVGAGAVKGDDEADDAEVADRVVLVEAELLACKPALMVVSK